MLQKLPQYFAYPSIFKLTLSFPCTVRKIYFSQMLRLLSAEKVTPTLVQSLPSSLTPFLCAICESNTYSKGPEPWV